MLKTGFRGERKRILTPSLSQGEEVCSDGEAKETSPFSHTQLSLATSMRGNVVIGKRKKPPPSPLQRGSVATEKGRNDE